MIILFDKCMYLQSVTQKLDKENVLLAPLSVWSLLALLVEGANGNTLRQLENILGIKADPNSIRRTYRTIQEFAKYKNNQSYCTVYPAQ